MSYLALNLFNLTFKRYTIIYPSAFENLAIQTSIFFSLFCLIIKEGKREKEEKSSSLPNTLTMIEASYQLDAPLVK